MVGSWVGERWSLLEGKSISIRRRYVASGTSTAPVVVETFIYIPSQHAPVQSLKLKTPFGFCVSVFQHSLLILPAVLPAFYPFFTPPPSLLQSALPISLPKHLLSLTTTDFPISLPSLPPFPNGICVESKTYQYWRAHTRSQFQAKNCCE